MIEDNPGMFMSDECTMDTISLGGTAEIMVILLYILLPLPYSL